MTDPTPAATARDALVEALDSIPPKGRHYETTEHYADRVLAALPDGWTLAAPAPTPSDPVARCGTCDEPKDHWRHGFATWSDHPDGHPFIPGARDE